MLSTGLSTGLSSLLWKSNDYYCFGVFFVALLTIFTFCIVLERERLNSAANMIFISQTLFFFNKNFDIESLENEYNEAAYEILSCVIIAILREQTIGTGGNKDLFWRSILDRGILTEGPSDEKNKPKNKLQSYVKRALFYFMELIYEFSQEIEQEAKIPFEELKNMLGEKFKEFCQERDENEIGALVESCVLRKNDLIQSLPWFCDDIFFVKEKEGIYRAVLASTLCSIAYEAFVIVKMELEERIFSKKSTNIFAKRKEEKSNCLNVSVNYRFVVLQYNFLISELLRAMIFLARKQKDENKAPEILRQMLRRYGIYKGYPHLACVFYPIKREGGKFYDCLGNLLEDKTVVACNIVKDFLKDLNMRSDDPILDDIERELSLKFEDLKDMFGPSFKDNCENSSEEFLGSSFHAVRDGFPKGIDFYEKDGKHFMIFRDKSADLTSKYFDWAIKRHCVFLLY